MVELEGDSSDSSTQVLQEYGAMDTNTNASMTR